MAAPSANSCPAACGKTFCYCDICLPVGYVGALAGTATFVIGIFAKNVPIIAVGGIGAAACMGLIGRIGCMKPASRLGKADVSLDQKITRLETENKKLKAAAASFKLTSDGLRETIDHLATQNSSLSKAAEEAQKRVLALAKENDELQLLYQTVKTTCDTISRSITTNIASETAAHAAADVSLDEDLEQLTAQLLLITQAVVNLQTATTAIQKENDSLRDLITQLQKEKEALISEKTARATLLESERTLQTHLDAKARDLADLNTRLTALLPRLDRYKKSLSRHTTPDTSSIGSASQRV